MRYWTDRDDWMHELQYADLFDASHTPIPEEEKHITRVLDRLVDKVLNHPEQIALWVNEMRQVDQATRLVLGRPRKRQQNLATVSGTNYDALLKELVQREFNGGDLQAVRNRLEVIPTRPNAQNRAKDAIKAQISIWRQVRITRDVWLPGTLQRGTAPTFTFGAMSSDGPSETGASDRLTATMSLSGICRQFSL